MTVLIYGAAVEATRGQDHFHHSQQRETILGEGSTRTSSESRLERRPACQGRYPQDRRSYKGGRSKRPEASVSTCRPK